MSSHHDSRRPRPETHAPAATSWLPNHDTDAILARSAALRSLRELAGDPKSLWTESEIRSLGRRIVNPTSPVAFWKAVAEAHRRTGRQHAIRAQTPAPRTETPTRAWAVNQMGGQDSADTALIRLPREAFSGTPQPPYAPRDIRNDDTIAIRRTGDSQPAAQVLSDTTTLAVRHDSSQRR